MWFTKGQFSIQRQDDELVISDLRMGVAPDFVFGFSVARVNDGVAQQLFPRRINNRNFSWRKIEWLMQRLTRPDLSLPVGNLVTGLPTME